MKLLSRRTRRRWKNRVLNLLWWLSLAGFLLSAGVLALYGLKTAGETRQMNRLAQQVEAAGQNPASLPQQDAVLQTYAALAKQNSDFAGWVSIEGTALHYPVMQTKQSPEFYLRRDFEKKYALSGTPFADAACDLNAEGQNMILYGHNMKNGTMFHTLQQYLDEAYWQQHPQVRFDTLARRAQYRVFAVLVVDTDAARPDALAAYQPLQDASRQQYEDYIAYLKANARYDTGITPVWGESLLTLSTCTNQVETERIVVAAVRLPTNTSESEN